MSPRPFLCSPSASRRRGPRSCHPTNAISTRQLGCTQGSHSHNGPSLFCQVKAGLRDSKPLSTCHPLGLAAIFGHSEEGPGSHFWQMADDQNQGYGSYVGSEESSAQSGKVALGKNRDAHFTKTGGKAGVGTGSGSCSNAGVPDEALGTVNIRQ